MHGTGKMFLPELKSVNYTAAPGDSRENATTYSTLHAALHPDLAPDFAFL